MDKYIFNYDIKAIQEDLNKLKTDDEKLECINRQLTTTKTMLELIKKTKVAEADESSGWGIHTDYETLSDLFEHQVKKELEYRNRQKQNIDMKDVLQVTNNFLKEELTKYFIFLKNEYNYIDKRIQSTTASNLKVDESMAIPSTKDFTEKYIEDEGIEIENVVNKSDLEKEIYRAWNKQYPNNPRKLSTFHKNLPRKA